MGRGVQKERKMGAEVRKMKVEKEDQGVTLLT